MKINSVLSCGSKDCLRNLIREHVTRYYWPGFRILQHLCASSVASYRIHRRFTKNQKYSRILAVFPGRHIRVLMRNNIKDLFNMASAIIFKNRWRPVPEFDCETNLSLLRVSLTRQLMIPF